MNHPLAEVRRRLLQYSAVIAGIIVAAATELVESSVRKDPEPYHTSILSGEGWVMELILGHPDRIRCELGMSTQTFTSLVQDLRVLGVQNSRSVTLEEQLAIFLYTCVTGLSIRHVGERFQRSNGTISRYFRKMATLFSSDPFYSEHVHLPAANDIHPKIQANPRFWPYFKDSIGAIDGSHIPAAPPASERSAYRNRKGFLSQNCLFACDFDIFFTYSLTGWEGSATDARIYQDARTHNLVIPEGKYLLADSGFPSRPGLLIPYRNTRYHLAEWRRANLRPANKEELFNLRHASARNAVERIFGVLKRRFRILSIPPEYSLEVQATVPVALAAIHNFIKYHPDGDQDHDLEHEAQMPVVQQVEHDLGEGGEDTGNRSGDVEVEDEDEDEEGEDDGEGADEDHGEDEEVGAGQNSNALRDRIAHAMWNDYQRILQERLRDGELE